MSQRRNYILLHIAASIGFLLVPVLTAPWWVEHINVLEEPRFWEDIIWYSLTLIYIYLNLYYFLPRFYFPAKYWAFAGITLLSFILISILPELVIGHGPPPHGFKGGHGNPHGPPHPPQGELRFLHELSSSFAKFCAVLVLTILIKTQSWLKEVKREKIIAELSYLKAQINPHFLFNALNTIYSLSIEKSSKTPTAVVTLSGMMRYVLESGEKEDVLLSKELDYISDYIALQKLRFQETVEVSYAIEGNADGHKISPLLLIPLIENAFKYGVNPAEQSTIQIVVSITSEHFTMRVENRKNVLIENAGDKTGVGLANLRNRLEHIYPGKHKLEINDNNQIFVAVLSLQLT